jgi:hypothetical protein
MRVINPGPAGRDETLIGLLALEAVGLIVLATQTPTGDTPDPLAYVAQYGILGIILLMFMTGYIWAKPSVDEMRKRQAEERKVWVDEVLPAVKDLTKALEGVQAELRRQHENR